ncbi:TOR complex subunit lst8 [Irineochytrium annulatum]|nr:TOR complex subunit lst8 [Irineochytrium annulatum]
MKLYTSADDGKVMIWDWHSGTCLSSFIRHSAAVRCFALYPDRPDRVMCGRSDGNITTWDVTVKSTVDNIMPDPDWVAEGDEQSMVGWMGVENHHSGAILSLCVSLNGRFLASGATDHTAKLWTVVSYLKNVDEVQNEQKAADQQGRQLDGYIQAHDDRFDIQIELKEFTGLRIGEVPIPMGYHADLIFTFRHEAPVSTMQFNRASEHRSHNICFQICQIFEVQASEKEDELPEYWKRHELDSAIEKLEGMKRFGLTDAAVTVPELKQLISHGLVLPSFLETLITQFSPEVNGSQLKVNMKKFELQPKQILRLIVNSKFHPRDILSALSGKPADAEHLYNAINSKSKGNPITNLMLKQGFKTLGDDDNDDQKKLLNSLFVEGAFQSWKEEPHNAAASERVGDFFDDSDEDEFQWFMV